tara:strand:- start:124 stop:546 length:423 start_codon:yes stop_codon:yes gene_type:complete
MKVFETEEDLAREFKAIDRFIQLFSGKAEKLGKWDLDYEVYDKNDKFLVYAEVKGRKNKSVKEYPLPIALRKLHKMQDGKYKNSDCIIIWACEDGIIYGEYKDILGSVAFGGRTPRKGSSNDLEMMVYYNPQQKLKTVLY